jgi:hypothetical protein
MTSLRPARHWLLLLLLYVAIDFMDPSIPGVFCFDTEFFFVDGVVHAKLDASRNLVAAEPTALWPTVNHDDPAPSVNAQLSARPVSAQPHRQKLKHDDSASFGSVSSSDSVPTPPSS